MKVDIGVSEKGKKEIAKFLSKILADTYILYMKSQNFHWNLLDPRFFSLHLLFEKQYEELAGAVDTLAEKIRSSGFFAPGTLKEMIELSDLKESKGHLNGDEMIHTLVFGHEFICNQLHKGITLCQKHKDESTVDLCIERMRVHEKQAYFLRSHFVK